MTINFWTLGLQAINVLILMWLLSWVFWKPLATAIAKRQAATQATLDDAKALQDKADAELRDVTKARDGMAAERDAVLREAAQKAEAAVNDAMKAARAQAEDQVKAAALIAADKVRTARVDAEQASVTLAIAMARKLLDGLDTQAVQSAFQSRLVGALAAMPAQDRAALANTKGGIDLATSADVTADQQAALTEAVQTALGAQPEIRFVTDPALIAGMELRTPHFTLHNSWQADLDDIHKGLTDAQ